MNYRRALLVVWLVSGIVAVGEPVRGQDRPAPVREPVLQPLPEHQDSVRLTRLTSAVLPSDGLLTFRLQQHTSETVFILNDFLGRVDQTDYSLSLEAGLRPWLHVWAEVPWRSWSGGTDWIEPTGSGWGDGRWQVVASRSLLGNWFHVAALGGGNIPMGSQSSGLTEGAFSPQVAGAATIVMWSDSNVPEMRLHFNWGQTWNRAEDTGYGAGFVQLNPWSPRYQSAAAAGGNSANDTRDLGVGLEFRAGSTSLWVEYSQQLFRGNDTVSTAEQMRMVGAGLRWGLVEGWAVHGNYLVSIADDDEETPWWPGYPDLVVSLGLSKQFGFGGVDTDGDGVRDRHDPCPLLAEDLDGYQDEDGCPEYDNDMDGIPDVIDGAPDEPEDFDGFEDGDGVPDRDNDNDGILDLDDLCPDEAEDFDGYHDDDGCPDEFADRDGDGVDDATDNCPEDREDIDGFEDEDGCPDYDNDLDGILDLDDQCPNDAENYNGVDDDDGCPEPQ